MIDWATIISIAGIVGTWVTIALVYFTLREMRNQRKAAQKPDLVLPKTKVYGYVYGKKDMKGLLIPRQWSNDEDFQIEYDSWGEQASIKLYNVGFGVAKNIELNWTMEYLATMEQIKEYCYQNSLPIIIQRVEEDNRFGVVEANTKPKEFFPLNPQTFKHDFLMPASISSEGLSSVIPPAFRELVSILVYLKSDFALKHSGRLIQLEIDIPSLELEVHYDDMENTHYSKKFDVVFSITSYWIPMVEKDVSGLRQVLTGAFEFKKHEHKYIMEPVVRMRRAERRRKERET
jgi:hypothetical protein